MPWRRARTRNIAPERFGPWPEGAMLVGGAVRDALLGREATDLDWLVRDPRAACEATAQLEGGSCFALDEDRGHWRAVGGVAGITHDFVPLRGSVEDDLRRRDLTINALALTRDGELVDPTDGIADLERKVVRMTSEGSLRADPVRPLRAVRFTAALGFEIDAHTRGAVRTAAAGQMAGIAPAPAPERVRDELTRMLHDEPASGLALAHQLGLLATFLPELEACVGVEQGPLHHLDVFRHSLEAVRLLVSTFPDSGVAVRLATLLHDVGKPEAMGNERIGRPTFHGHDKVGAQITAHVLRRLRYDADTVRHASGLVRRHMLPLPTTNRGARRFVHRYRELLPDLLCLMLADREAARGRAAGSAGRTRYRLAMSRVLGVLQEPTPEAPLLSGDDVMDLLGLEPGPAVGEALKLVSEARAVGDVSDREGAEALLRRYADAQGWTGS